MEEPGNPIISFEGADILAGENVVIYGLDMQVRAGEIVYIIGKVGSEDDGILITPKTRRASIPLASGA